MDKAKPFVKFLVTLIAILALSCAAFLAGCSTGGDGNASNDNAIVNEIAASPDTDDTANGDDAVEADTEDNVAPDAATAPAVPATTPAADAGGKSLVVYFSRTGEQYQVGVIDKGNTAMVADEIAKRTGPTHSRSSPSTIRIR